MKKKVPTKVQEHFLDEWVKIKTPKVLVEKLDEYEDVRGKTKRPAVPFISKEKSYRKTIPLNTRSSPSQLEDRDEDLRIVALELGETVAEKVTIVELTEIIKENKYFKENIEFAKELIQYTFEDRKKAEEDRKRVEEDRKKEAENRLREKELELELARLHVGVNSDNE
ncbi:hypothetical protein TNIN_155361 [Trichonephila inaurata madagascariensis]|uniref:Uncharacterized protein n=1 Tax=Trichonephila inaurata madagascariensis TaxID=2747483 RepID=A0A8X6YW90_9ARAC|nr:hypothetical protein TNIN_155361 [Trichonephila inaurata madagascariensis]